MARAMVDPAELRRFARDLGRFNAELEGLVSGIKGRMAGLESTWRDQEQRKFAEEFNQAIKALARFSEVSREHAQFLSQKAGHIEAYLNQK